MRKTSIHGGVYDMDAQIAVLRLMYEQEKNKSQKSTDLPVGMNVLSRRTEHD